MAGLEENFDVLSFNDFKFAEKKPGKEGRRHKVTANFADIKIKEKTVIYQYNIEIEIPERNQQDGDKNSIPAPRPGVPERELKRQRRMIDGSNLVIFNAFLAQHKDSVFKLEDGSLMTEPVFDGRKIFYTRHQITLNGADNKRGSYEIKVKVPEKKFPQRFTIRVTTPPDAHRIDLSSLAGRNLQSAEMKLQALDIIISYAAKKYNLVLNQKMFVRKNDLLEMNAQQRQNIRFALGELKEGSFGHHQVSGQKVASDCKKIFERSNSNFVLFLFAPIHLAERQADRVRRAVERGQNGDRLLQGWQANRPDRRVPDRETKPAERWIPAKRRRRLERRLQSRRRQPASGGR